MRKYLLPFLLVCSLLLSSCAYVNVRAPYDRDIDNTGLGSKVGKATSHGAIWLFAWGDSSYAAAAKNGNITIMKHADQEIKTYLFGLYSRRTIIVYGD